MFQNFGWVPHPKQTEAFAKTIPSQIYSSIDNLTKFVGDGKNVKLWEPLVKLLGKDPLNYQLPARNQGNKGSCVGNADAGAQDLLYSADIIERKEPEEFKGLHSAVGSYIASRQIAGMLGGPDGSYGSAMAQAVREIGTLIQGVYDGIDLREYSIEAIEKMDVRGKGLTPAMIQMANSHLIDTTAQILTLDQLDAVLYQYYPVNLCSMFGSRDRRRDSYGCLRWNGQWPHSMLVCGIIYVRGTKVYIVRNSWGSEWMMDGPLCCPNMPLGSFGMYPEDMKRALASRDSFARAGHHGFIKRNIDLDYALAF